MILGKAKPGKVKLILNEGIGIFMPGKDGNEGKLIVGREIPGNVKLIERLGRGILIAHFNLHPLSICIQLLL